MVVWRAQFNGDHSTLFVEGREKEAIQFERQGQTISEIMIDLPPGSTRTVRTHSRP
jgi:hypothetical protein